MGFRNALQNSSFEIQSSSFLTHNSSLMIQNSSFLLTKRDRMDIRQRLPRASLHLPLVPHIANYRPFFNTKSSFFRDNSPLSLHFQ